ncbi:MAG TPA: hypothetical protein C5S50_10375 [Methanosarcinaceae archaeon]|nr:hypothetical protein [Methanosarcinaceae archaeon]
MSEPTEKYKVVIVVIFLAASASLIYYSHAVLETGVLFTHLFYIPIIYATMWWKRKGLVVPIFLAVILNLSHIYIRKDIITYNDQIRSLMFIVIGFMVAELSDKVSKGEKELRKSHEKLKHNAVELATINEELVAFNYSVSHDLRSPLRSIDGFSQALLEDYTDKLDAQGKDYLTRVRVASQKMAQLIDDLLNLSRMTRTEMQREVIDLSALAQGIASEFQNREPERHVEFVIAEGMEVNGDKRLLMVVLENLLGNAWKFTGKHPEARIECGVTQVNGKPAYFVRDDGAGFDMTYADKLFGSFQRLHGTTEFPGTGIGLATVKRIVHRHGGLVWAKGEVEHGATFYFTL